ncbi:MAG: DUF7681 family protein [Geminicoccaceae bacterium]
MTGIVMPSNTEPKQFDNGLSDEKNEWLDQLRIETKRLIEQIEALPRHRSLSLAITKLEEAEHWLRDRSIKPS